jgi:S-(hydroxymethyl)glutathione dehydrogenase/alcohol dehydrogenase
MDAAVLYEANTPLKIEDVELGEPGPGEVLVDLKASGVCHSDWHVVKGEWNNLPLPSILGHEGAGIVEAVGPSVANLKRGDHVVLSWRPSCGICERCQSGWPNICDNGPAVNTRTVVTSTELPVGRMAALGTFSEATIVPEVAAVRVEKDIPFEQAALVGCGVATGVGAAINTAKVQPGTTVAVFGAGGVGLNCIQGASISSASIIIAVDLLDSKLELAREFGATHTINASDGDVVERIKALTDGEGVHYAFESIGLVAEPFVQSILCTRPRGLTVWVGHAPMNTPVTIDARDLMREKMVIGSMYGSSRPHVDFRRYLDLYRAGKLKLDELVSKRFGLIEVNDAFEALRKGEVARGVLVFD